MAKSKVTSAKAAKAASQVLSSPSSSKAAKAAAGSALSQKPPKKSRWYGGGARLAPALFLLLECAKGTGSVAGGKTAISLRR